MSSSSSFTLSRPMIKLSISVCQMLRGGLEKVHFAKEGEWMAEEKKHTGEMKRNNSIRVGRSGGEREKERERATGRGRGRERVSEDGGFSHVNVFFLSFFFSLFGFFPPQSYGRPAGGRGGWVAQGSEFT